MQTCVLSGDSACCSYAPPTAQLLLALCEHLSAVDPKTDLPRVHPKTAKKYASVLRKMLLSHEEYGMAAGTDCLAPGSVRGCQTALRQSDTHTKQHGQPLAAYHALLVRALPQA
jgi:hypothetical protein